MHWSLLRIYMYIYQHLTTSWHLHSCCSKLPSLLHLWQEIFLLTFVSAPSALQPTLNPVVNMRTKVLTHFVHCPYLQDPIGYGFSFLVWFHLLTFLPLVHSGSKHAERAPSSGPLWFLGLFSVIHIPHASLAHLLPPSQKGLSWPCCLKSEPLNFS